MGTIILLLILIFIVWPICKALWRGHKLTRQWQEATGRMREAYERAAREQQQQSRPEPEKKKKIDPSVGEYVAFEELKVDTTVETKTSADGKTSNVRVESQIEDATWEEIR